MMVKDTLGLAQIDMVVTLPEQTTPSTGGIPTGGKHAGLCRHDRRRRSSVALPDVDLALKALERPSCCTPSSSSSAAATSAAHRTVVSSRLASNPPKAVLPVKAAGYLRLKARDGLRRWREFISGWRAPVIACAISHITHALQRQRVLLTPAPSQQSAPAGAGGEAVSISTVPTPRSLSYWLPPKSSTSNG